jgi:hypothetical protein
MARSIYRSQINDIGNLLIAGSSIIIESNGRISANVTTTTSLAGLTTANLAEGSNLYYTNSRVLSALTGNVTVGNLIATGNITTNTGGFIGIGTSLPDSDLSILAYPQTVSYSIFGNSTTQGTDLHISGADGSNTRITQDAFGTGSYVAFTGRSARGTAAGPTQTQLGDTIAQFTGRGFSNGSLQFGNTSTGRIDVVAAEAFTDTSRATNVQIFTTLSGTITPTAIATFSSAGGLSVAGNVTAGNIIANGLVIRNINVSDIVLTGNVAAEGGLSGQTIVVTSITSNVWNGLYTANVIETAGNLYFTNARVNSNVIAFLPSLAGTGINIQANGQINANAQTVSLTGLSTTNLAEGSNLYYTNTRVRTAFTAGKGIAILGDGTIKSTAAGGDYNTSLTGAAAYTISNVSAGVTFTGSTTADRFIIRSIQVTNISDGNAAYVSSNVLYSTGNTAYLGNLISVPLGGVTEFIGRTQILQSGDSLYFQGFDNNFTPTSNILSAYITYETITNDTSYVGAGQALAASNSNVLLVTADTADFVVESIKFVNLKPTNIPIKLYVANATTTLPKAYLAYNVQVPAGSSLEVLQSPKALKKSDAIYASYANSSNADSIAVFTSYRKTETTTVGYTTGTASIGNTAIVTFNTSVPEGTVLYYTIR